jgi:hypothetical protein
LLDSKKLAVRHKDWNFRFGGYVKFQYDDDFFTAGNSAALARQLATDVTTYAEKILWNRNNDELQLRVPCSFNSL